MSTSAHVLADERKPPSSEGKPARKTPRSQLRRERSRERRETKMVNVKALLRGMREMEAERDSQHKTNTTALK